MVNTVCAFVLLIIKFNNRLLLFICRSANFYHATGVCELSEMDRITLAGSSSFQPFDGEYIERDDVNGSGSIMMIGG